MRSSCRGNSMCEGSEARRSFACLRHWTISRAAECDDGGRGARNETVEINSAGTWWLTNTSRLTHLHRPVSSFPQEWPISVSGTTIHKSRGYLASSLSLVSTSPSVIPVGSTPAYVLLTTSIATAIHGPSRHLISDLLSYLFPLGSGFLLALNVLNWFPHQAFAVLPLIVPRLALPHDSGLTSVLTSSEKASPSRLPHLLWEAFSLTSPTPVIFCSISLFYPLQCLSEMDVIWPPYQSMVSVFHMRMLVAWGQTSSGLAPRGCCHPSLRSRPTASPGGLGLRGGPAPPTSDRPEAEDPDGPDGCCKLGQLTPYASVFSSGKRRVWTWWLPSAKILWLIIAREHQLGKRFGSGASETTNPT